MTLKIRKNLAHICPYRLNQTYHTLYERQHKLGISDEFLHSTVKLTSQEAHLRPSLLELLQASREARDDIITWYLKQTLVELNVTVSLLTAKIKFIEYKLGLCDGLDLHQACSLSLVDFCNILSDLTVVNTSPAARKKMHTVSAEANMPVWLSHYRNQICHVPSEGPCIAILVPLVQKSLQYMKDTFWSKVVEHETFDEKRFKKFMSYVSKLTHITCANKRLQLKNDAELGKRRLKIANENLVKYSRVCVIFRRHLIQNPQPALDATARFVVSSGKFDDKTRNNALLLAQLSYAKCFERFLFKLISMAEQNPRDENTTSWLKTLIRLISAKNRSTLKENLTKLDIMAHDLAKFIDVSPIKCCRIAYRLMRLEGPVFRGLFIGMRHKLLPILGKERVQTLVRMTSIVAHQESE